MATVNCPKCETSFDPTNCIIREGGATGGLLVRAQFGPADPGCRLRRKRPG